MNHKSALKGIQTIQVLVGRSSLELAGCDGLFEAIYMDDAKLVAAYSEEQAALMISQPAWYTAVYALAVFGEAIGCLGLLLRKKWALWPLMLSLLCVVIQHIYYLTSETYRFVEGRAWIMVLLIPCMF